MWDIGHPYQTSPANFALCRQASFEPDWPVLASPHSVIVAIHTEGLWSLIESKQPIKDSAKALLVDHSSAGHLGDGPHQGLPRRLSDAYCWTAASSSLAR
jgi:hypothetical protein